MVVQLMHDMPNRSKHPQLNMRVPQDVIDRLKRVQALLEQLHGHAYSQANAIGYALLETERSAEKELVKMGKKG
jgi:hypothetical protein